MLHDVRRDRVSIDTDSRPAPCRLLQRVVHLNLRLLYLADLVLISTCERVSHELPPDPDSHISVVQRPQFHPEIPTRTLLQYARQLCRVPRSFRVGPDILFLAVAIPHRDRQAFHERLHVR